MRFKLSPKVGHAPRRRLTRKAGRPGRRRRRPVRRHMPRRRRQRNDALGTIRLFAHGRPLAPIRSAFNARATWAADIVSHSIVANELLRHFTGETLAELHLAPQLCYPTESA